METGRDILRSYEKLSGQKASLQKSSVVFGKKMAEEKKNMVKRISGIKREGGDGVYLGLPEMFVGSKVATLHFLEERVSAKINNWFNRFLSHSGKEGLIKAVALALPTYSMSCFKLPKSLCAKIEYTFARFWWKNQETGKGIH